MASSSTSAEGYEGGPAAAAARDVACTSTDALESMSREEKMAHAKKLHESLEAQQKFIEGKTGETITFDQDSFTDKKTPHFRNLTDCRIELDESLKITRVMMNKCHRCTLIIRSTVITSTLEIWECSEVEVEVASALKTVQADVCRDISIAFAQRDAMGTIIQAGMSGFRLSFAGEEPTEVGLEHIRSVIGDAPLDEKMDQFFTRWIEGTLLTEKVIRLEDGFPTTERERREEAGDEPEAELALRRAEKKKEEGNAAFKEGAIQQALVLYSEALMIKSDHHICLSNRAACFLSMGDFTQALEDASKCVALKPDFVKGHFRKGLSLNGLERYQEAVEAFEAAQRLDPHNATIQASVKVALYKAQKQAMGITK